MSVIFNNTINENNALKIKFIILMTDLLFLNKKKNTVSGIAKDEIMSMSYNADQSMRCITVEKSAICHPCPELMLYKKKIHFSRVSKISSFNKNDNAGLHRNNLKRIPGLSKFNT